MLNSRFCWMVLVGLSFCAIGVRSDAQILFEYQPVTTDILYDVTTGEGAGSVSIFNAELSNSPGFPNNVQGWALRLAHDSTLLESIAIDQGAYIETIDPDFWQTELLPTGITIGTVYSFIGNGVCLYAEPKEIAVITYQTVAPTFVGDQDGETAILVFSQLGTPPVSNVMVVAGAQYPVDGLDGIVNLTPSLDSPIIRGDANANGSIDPLVDSIINLNYLFVSGTTVDCLDALDCNDDGSVNLADPILLLSWGFAMGPPLPQPFPDCGEDPTDDPLSCDASGCP